MLVIITQTTNKQKNNEKIFYIYFTLIIYREREKICTKILNQKLTGKEDEVDYT